MSEDAIRSEKVGHDPLEIEIRHVQNGERDRDIQFVLDLLDHHGGQLPQQKIVELSPWGKSKVSVVLSEMDNKDLIVKIQIGLQNLIWTAESGPEFSGE